MIRFPALLYGLLALTVAGVATGLVAARLSSRRVMNEVLADIRNEDAAALAGRVDWPDFRDALREEITAGTATNFELRGGLHAPIGGYAEAVVVRYGRPEAVADLLTAWRATAADIDPAHFITAIHLNGPLRFSIEWSDPRQAHSPKFRASFGLHDMRWALDDIQIPISLLPIIKAE